MASECRKRKSFTLEAKIKLIEEVDRGIKTKAMICRDHGLSSGTLYTILKDREKILATVDNDVAPQRKRNRATDYDDVDKALLMWFKQARNLKLTVSGPILIEKGEYLAKSLGYSNFKMSIGWLDRFKHRHGISFKEINGNSAPVKVKVETYDNWEAELQAVQAQYSPCDIFSVDETALFYKCLPTDLTATGETSNGLKTPKERISLLIGANMDGSEKLPLLAIGHILKPPCFKNIKTLPVTYKWNPQSWVTSKIFEEWMRELDLMFLVQQRTIALIINTSNAHSRLIDLKAVKLIFVPCKSSKLQPCKQGIIRSLKMHYRKRVLQRYIDNVEETGPDCSLQLSLLDAITMISAAWNEVTSQTVASSFQRAGFCPEDTKQPSASDAKSEKSEFRDLYKRLADLVPLQSSIDNYICVDERTQTSEDLSLTLDDIASSVRNSIDKSAAEEDSDSKITISSAEASKALETMRMFFFQHENTYDALTQLNSLESLLNRTVLKS